MEGNEEKLEMIDMGARTDRQYSVSASSGLIPQPISAPLILDLS